MINSKRCIPAGLAAGVLVAHFIFIVGAYRWPVLVLVLWLLVFKPRNLQFALVIGLLWTSVQLHTRLADRLDPELANTLLTIEGRVESLPEVFEDFTRFHFSPRQLPESANLPDVLLVSWFRNSPVIEPGDSWRLDLRVTPPWGRVNFQGPDKERWLFAEGLGGLATVSSGERISRHSGLWSGWNGIRQALRLRIEEFISSKERLGVVLALAIADRSKLQSNHRKVLARTGTSHLLAISGLHVGLAALFGFWFARVLTMTIPGRWRGGTIYPSALIAGLVTAFVYAGLAGFGTSTIRALIMLTVGALALLSRRVVHPAQALVIALAVLLLYDPFAVLGAGFWMSFSAVAVLMFIFSPRHNANVKMGVQLLRAQAGIMVFLLPLSAWWFQTASGSGFVTNLLAIPWLSFIVVPLVLLGIITLPLSQTLSALAFCSAGYAAEGLLIILGAVAAIPASSFKLFQPNLWSTLLASLGALVLLLPGGLRYRWLGLLLFVPLYSPGKVPAGSDIRLEVLDVGQGTAVLVQSNKHLLIYDSGPGNGLDYDLVDQVIHPAIMHSGIGSPDRILVSHADMDHAGGLNRMRELYPEAVRWASLPLSEPGVEPCHSSLNWIGDGVRYDVLHPTSYLPYLGNDSSCVLSLRNENFSVLIPGDISKAVESRLIYEEIAPHDVLLVPHHGSKTSSSVAFLKRISPQFAVATAGLGNRFGFPRDEIRERYLRLEIPLWSSGECGAIRIISSASGTIAAYSARRERDTPWRWPAEKNCP